MITQELATRMKQSAREHYHHANWEHDFDRYWSGTICMRMDAPIPYATYWEDVRALKLEAWNEEALASGVGK